MWASACVLVLVFFSYFVFFFSYPVLSGAGYTQLPEWMKFVGPALDDCLIATAALTLLLPIALSRGLRGRLSAIVPEVAVGLAALVYAWACRSPTNMYQSPQMEVMQTALYFGAGSLFIGSCWRIADAQWQGVNRMRTLWRCVLLMVWLIASPVVALAPMVFSVFGLVVFMPFYLLALAFGLFAISGVPRTAKLLGCVP